MSNVTDEVKNIVRKAMMGIATQGKDPAPPGPASAPQTPVQPPAEPILFEKDGWGIYTPYVFFVNTYTTGFGPEGSILTHIGCDCAFPHWAFAHVVTRDADQIAASFKCPECEESLRLETYKTFVQVYRFINALHNKTGEWDI